MTADPWGWEDPDSSPSPGPAATHLPPQDAVVLADDWRAQAELVRMHNATRIRDILGYLEPYVQGLMGPINPRFVDVYLKSLGELAKLYRVYAPPPPPAPEPEPEPDPGVEGRLRAAQLAAARAGVLGQLKELESRGR